MIDKLRIELANAYRQFGDSETDIRDNINIWIERLSKEENEPIEIMLTDGAFIRGIDIHVAVKIETPALINNNETSTQSHAESCVIMITDNDIIMLKYEYDIIDDKKNENLYTNQVFKKATLADFIGEFSTIWP